MPATKHLLTDDLHDQLILFNPSRSGQLCDRAALKSGRDHHTANMGFITELATGIPGATGEVPNRVAPVAEMLRLNGYSTAAFGKYHETRPALPLACEQDCRRPSTGLLQRLTRKGTT